MNHFQQLEPETDASWAKRLQGTNINEKTFLATDYLNHFNEAIMLIEMVPDMPDMLEDVLAWERKSYIQHFAESGFQDKELAIEAYARAPVDVRSRFDGLVASLNGVIWVTQHRLDAMIGDTVDDALAEAVATSVAKLHRLVETASGVINGGDWTGGQQDIDRVLSV